MLVLTLKQGVIPLADMNVTAARPGLTPIQWGSDFWVEYLRENQFTPYFGTSMDAMIQLQTDLTRKPGDTVVFPTIRNLVGAGVTGNTVLEGNEEVLNARSLNVTVRRHPPRRRSVGVGRAEVGHRPAPRRSPGAEELGGE